MSPSLTVGLLQCYAIGVKWLPSWKNALLALLGAGLLILAFPDFEWWWTAWFALVPLMWAVEREQASTFKSFLLGWLFGTAFFFGTCWWLTYAPIHYAAVPWPIAYLLILIACLGAGVFPGIFAAILSILLRRFGSRAFLAAPFVWVFSEFLRYWVTGNNWNAVGYSQAWSPWLTLPSIGGVYATSFQIIGFTSVIFAAYTLRRGWSSADKHGIKQFALGIIGLILWMGPVMMTRTGLENRKTVYSGNIIAVQPNVPMSGIDSSKLRDLRDRQVAAADAELQAMRIANHELPTTVILPESPMNFMYHDDREFQQFIGDFARRNNVSVLFNSAEPDATNGRYFNSAVMVGADGKKLDQYDKLYLLPFGEAVPWVLESVVPAFVGNFSYGREYDLLPVGDAKAGVMICFESHFGQLSREYVRNGADVIIEMTNDGYLGPTPVLRQHLANAVFRAVETNRPVLRVTNVGITTYITENGTVLDPLPVYQEGTRVWTVSKSDGSQTFYVKYGDWFAWLCSVVTMGLLIFGIRRRPDRRPSVTLPLDPSEFWGTNYYNHPKLTDKMIRKAENKLGVKLPNELIALLRIQNGGYTKGFVFPMSVKTSWSSDHVPFNELGGIVTDPSHETAQNLLDSSPLSTEWDVPQRQVLLAGDGHFWITLDYRKGEEPSVAWIDTECDEDIPISVSFRDFLAGLVPSAEFVSADDYT